MISLDHIRTFAAVARYGSLSAAARSLGLTQPTVGRHIDLLESELKAILFARRREGMTLTDKGAALVDEAEEMLTAAAGFTRRAYGLDEDNSGSLRLSVNEVIGVLVFPHILPEFMERHSEIQVELVVTNAPANLHRRDADIAIRMFRPQQNDLIARKVCELPLGIYAHQRYLNRHAPPETLGDLRNHQMIGYDRETGIIDATIALGSAFTVEDFAFRTDNLLAQFEAIRSGVGIGLTHQGLAEKWKGVKRLLPELAIPPLELWLACHRDVRHNPRVRLMMEYLAETLKDPYSRVYSV